MNSLLRKQGKSTEPEEVGGVENRTIPGPGGEIPIRVYRPKGSTGLLARAREAVTSDENSALPILVYIHGGGWVLFDLDVYDAAPRALANQSGAIVVSVEYRHAPEHPFPAAHDVLAATRWVRENATSLGGDPNKIAIGGESVGGNMATTTCLRLQGVGEPLPIFQMLVYPVTDLVNQDHPSYEDSADAAPLNVAMLEWFGKYALSDPGQADDPRLSPLLAPTTHLSGLPPAIVITAESDPLRDQGEAYALGLMDTSVHVSLIRFPGTMHEFFGMTKVIDSSRLAVRQAALALNAAFEGLEPATSGK